MAVSGFKAFLVVFLGDSRILLHLEEAVHHFLVGLIDEYFYDWAAIQGALQDAYVKELAVVSVFCTSHSSWLLDFV